MTLGPGQRGIYFDSGGSRLLGTLLTGEGDAPKPTAIVLHGMPGIEKNYDLCYALRAEGFNALVFHYRGCWGSEGDFTMEGTAADTIAAIDHLTGAGFSDLVDPGRLFLVGHSMGGWAALQAGTDERVRAVCASAPVVDLADLEFSEEIAEQNFTPWLKGVTPREFGEQWRNLPPPYDAARSLNKPLLLVHGAKDEVIPLSHGRAVFDAASEPKQLIVHREANHAFIEQRSWYVNTILGWIQAVIEER